MSPQRRTALVSVGAACLLIVIKLVAGLSSGSLALLAEAAHSGTDLAAALLTFFAVSVAVRPADRGHPFGHAKAQNLAALAEGAFLIGVSLFIAGAAVARLTGAVEFEVDPSWWTFSAVVLVIAIDTSRLVVSFRAGRRYRSDALLASSLHFGSDLAGTLAVLVGLTAAAFGFPEGDAIAALFVAGLVILAAGQLLRRNVSVLMDKAPTDAERSARRAIAALEPPVELRRLRVRRSGGSHFADVVVHVEPTGAGEGVRERVLAAALGVSQVREIHNLTVLEVGGGYEVSLHLKLPGGLSLERAHAIAEQVEREIHAAVPEVDAVRTHLEPIAEPAAGEEAHVDEAAVAAAVRDETGAPPRELRFVRTDDGLVAFLTVALGAGESLADAHDRASALEKRIRSAVPEITDVVVHTEP
jgi:cation diffusion facilitator family transporter